MARSVLDCGSPLPLFPTSVLKSRQSFARRPFNARGQSASRRRAEAALWRTAKAEGLAQSKTWQSSHRPVRLRSVLECARL